MHVDFMRQPGPELPIAARPTEVTSLRVWHCTYKNFSALARYDRIEELIIGSFPEASLELIAALPRLRYLKIVHLPMVQSLSPLAKLNHLQSLSLATLPTWDTARRRTTVDSLEPLSDLLSLRHLELFGVCPPDRSLSALYGCSWLKTARFSQYPGDTVAEFYSATKASNDYVPSADFEHSAS
jgi:hypothetical protein